MRSTVCDGIKTQIHQGSTESSLGAFPLYGMTLHIPLYGMTLHILVAVRLTWNLSRGGTKRSTRYHVLYPVENPPKLSRTKPYRAIPCSGKAPSETRPSLQEVTGTISLRFRLQ